MRNMERYAEQGRALISKHKRYDIHIAEAEQIFRALPERPRQAILTAYYAGIEAGHRMYEKERKYTV